MTWPRISIVMPSYHQVQYLEEAIQSVLSQDYPNLQFGIVDGGSTDGSIAVISRYRARLDYVIIEPDGGQSEAINKGFKRAAGDIMGWLNSDDLLLPGALRTIGTHFAKHPGDDWIIGESWRTDATGRRVGKLRPTGDFTPAGALLRVRPFLVPQPSTFWRREILEHVGLLDESLHYCMDFELWLRFLLAGYRPRLLDVELAVYREHPASKTCAQAEHFEETLIDIEGRYAHRLPWWSRLQLYRMIGYQRRTLALRHARGRPWKEVVQHPWWLGSQQVRQALWYGAEAVQRAA